MEKNPILLIIDDEKIARETIKMLLFREGYEMVFAENAYEALAALEEVEPDVILLDVMMPEMDGFTLCQKLKSKPHLQHIPIILVTALDHKEDLARGLEAGADDFVNKPVNGLELRARVRSMLRIKQRQDDLQVMLRLREELSNMIVHDIRNPLATIQVFAEMLEDYVTDEKGLESLAMIRQEAQRLASFMTDMLMVAKMEHGRFVLNKASVNIKELLETVYQNYLPLAASNRITLCLDVPDTPREVVLDASLWHRVLDNLMSNALKFTPFGGTITLSAQYPADGEAYLENGQAGLQPTTLRIVIADEGPGIPEAHRESVFNRFEVVASGRRDIRQVGLGLAFCKMVVDAHNGRIFVTDNEPKGAKFVVEL